jgi:hypothetical protein
LFCSRSIRTLSGSLARVVDCDCDCGCERKTIGVVGVVVVGVVGDGSVVGVDASPRRCSPSVDNPARPTRVIVVVVVAISDIRAIAVFFARDLPHASADANARGQISRGFATTSVSTVRVSSRFAYQTPT